MHGSSSGHPPQKLLSNGAAEGCAWRSMEARAHKCESITSPSSTGPVRDMPGAAFVLRAQQDCIILLHSTLVRSGTRLAQR